MISLSRFRLQLRLANISFVLLFLVVVGLLMWLSRAYHVQFDWTKNARNSLSPASIALVKKLDRPLKITAFASERGGARKGISALIGRYQKFKPDLKLEFVSPDTEPTRVRDAGVQFDGELLVEYGANKENISQLREENITNALARLARVNERWIVFLSGHGERSPDRQANFDVSIWAGQLQKRGLKTRTLALSESGQIPQNTSVLVIAGPRGRLLPGEVKRIENYVARGGNLLWLNDPGPLRGLEPIGEMLGVEFQPGIIVDPASQTLTGNKPTFLVIAKYGPHPVVRDLNLLTLFPNASGIKANPPPAAAGLESWRNDILLDTNPTAWAETGPLTGDIKFDKGQDTRGPLNLGVTLTREYEKRQQRVALLGGGDFLSNAFLGNGGNLDLGMNLINWTANDDAQINIPPRIAPDLNLSLSPTAQIAIAAGFLFVLPLFLIGNGIFIWWRRRRR